MPIAPDTDCQPGDVRRDDLSVEAGTCANPLLEAGQEGPWEFGPACCGRQTERVLYDTARSGSEVTSEVGAVLRGGGCPADPCKLAPSTPEGRRSKELEVSILSTAPGPGGRNWVPERPTLKLGKERLKPCHTEPFYVVKESGNTSMAVAVMATLGVGEDDARAAEASEGSPCHAGGGQAKRDTPQERAARAAAMSLLASQAKGQIKGLRATFDVTGWEAQLKDAKLDADIVNDVTQKKERLNLPMRLGGSAEVRP